jgi:glycosyltransferase involved in cell wall biosynthesis
VIDASVILINRNGGAYLPGALMTCRRDLEATLEAHKRFELLVVDNGSTDDSLKVIKDHLEGAHFRWRLVCEPQAGVNYARNTGVRESTGEALIFVDSDVIFHPGWLQAYLAAFAKYPDIDVFGGRVALGTIEGQVPDWLDVSGPYRRPSIVVQIDHGRETKVMPLTDETGPVGPNMAFRRRVFDRIGLFDTRFGLRPGSLVAGAEAEFFGRLVSAHVPFVYVGEAVVDHPLKRAQISKRYFLRRLHGVGRVLARTHAIRGEKVRRIFGLTTFVGPKLARLYLRYLVSRIRGTPQEVFYLRGEIEVLVGYLHEDLANQLAGWGWKRAAS